jgi:phytoene synthase
MDTALQDSYAAAREVCRHHAKSFYFSSFGLPAAKRPRAFAVYAFCRHLDDEVDRVSDPARLPAVLAELRAFVERLFASGPSEDDLRRLPWLAAFLDTVRTCGIPAAYFMDLLAGVEMDRGRVRIATWEELDRYCYLVAGVVGLMMTRVFGLEDRAREKEALALGTAMQLTNILRDVAEDLERDRIYLPASELRRFGIDPARLRESRATPEWKAFMRFQVGRARDFYTSSEKGIMSLPDDGTRHTTWMMRLIYAGILDGIEQMDYDVFRGRARVPFWKKCLLAIEARRRCTP